MPLPRRLLAAGSIGAFAAAPAAAVPVTMTGIVLPSCILTVSTGGTLGVSADSGRQIGSEEVGGIPATLAIVATGGTPTLTVSAPTMSQRPAGYGGSPTVSVRYSSTGGANQAYTSGSSTYTSASALGDTMTINMRAQDKNGFAAGTYQLTTNVTCQQ